MAVDAKPCCLKMPLLAPTSSRDTQSLKWMLRELVQRSDYDNTHWMTLCIAVVGRRLWSESVSLVCALPAASAHRVMPCEEVVVTVSFEGQCPGFVECREWIHMCW